MFTFLKETFWVLLGHSWSFLRLSTPANWAQVTFFQVTTMITIHSLYYELPLWKFETLSKNPGNNNYYYFHNTQIVLVVCTAIKQRMFCCWNCKFFPVRSIAHLAVDWWAWTKEPHSSGLEHGGKVSASSETVIKTLNAAWKMEPPRQMLLAQVKDKLILWYLSFLNEQAFFKWCWREEVLSGA